MPTQYGMTVRPGYTHYNPRSYYYQLVKCYNCSIPHSHTVLTVSIITGLVGTAPIGGFLFVVSIVIVVLVRHIFLVFVVIIVRYVCAKKKRVLLQGYSAYSQVKKLTSFSYT